MASVRVTTNNEACRWPTYQYSLRIRCNALNSVCCKHGTSLTYRLKQKRVDDLQDKIPVGLKELKPLKFAGLNQVRDAATRKLPMKGAFLPDRGCVFRASRHYRPEHTVPSLRWHGTAAIPRFCISPNRRSLPGAGRSPVSRSGRQASRCGRCGAALPLGGVKLIGLPVVLPADDCSQFVLVVSSSGLRQGRDRAMAPTLQ